MADQVRNKTIHVHPHLEGGWAVRRHGARRALRVYPDREGAISFARTLSRRQNAEMVIHQRNGMVESKESYRAAAGF